MAISTPAIEEQREAPVAQEAVGQSVLRVDAREKVRGEPCYCGDLSLPNMLHGRVLRSRYPHARILSIDTSRAQGAAGCGGSGYRGRHPRTNQYGTDCRRPATSPY